MTNYLLRRGTNRIMLALPVPIHVKSISVLGERREKKREQHATTTACLSHDELKAVWIDQGHTGVTI